MDDDPEGDGAAGFRCACSVKVIAGIEDPVVIKRILGHFDRRAGQLPLAFGKGAPAPPQFEPPGLKE